jgi:Bacteriophage translational regulator
MEVGKKLQIDSLQKYDFYEPLEVLLHEDEDFLKIIETLTRVGVASKKEKKLVQSCHILHRQGRFWLVHFKELFAMSNRCDELLEDDIRRRNTIAFLLQSWGLFDVVQKDMLQFNLPVNCVKVIPFKNKKDWTLLQKYTMNSNRKKKDVDPKTSE